MQIELDLGTHFYTNPKPDPPNLTLIIYNVFQEVLEHAMELDLRTPFHTNPNLNVQPNSIMS